MVFVGEGNVVFLAEDSLVNVGGLDVFLEHLGGEGGEEGGGGG